jgi:phospholipid/cholesterol/gamma-HCH transport system substrate-binding protein
MTQFMRQMRRSIRDNRKDFVAILVLSLIGLVSLGIILSNQRLALPGWVPVIGSERFELKAELSTAQSLTPGQGQSVEIAGVRVGEISNVQLQDGHALVTMDVEDKYTLLIHPDASILVRPKTGLNDMVLEVDPGAASGTMKKGSTIPLASTLPNVNPDEILATLDGDTRGFLNLLLADGAKGLGGHGPQLSATLRRLEPTSRDLARIGGALAVRRENIRNSIHNFRLLAEELGSNDQTLGDFIDSSNGVLSSFARQESSIRNALKELPATLKETHGALTGTEQLASQAGPALHKLLPGARALAPTLKQTQPFFTQTTAPIRDQIRPFTRQVRTPVTHLSQAAQALGGSIPPLDSALSSLNTGLNALAYNPPGQGEGFLFYLPWLNHDTNSQWLTQDAHGPLRRGIVTLSCSTARIAESVTAIRPFLKTALQLTRVPTVAEIC